jgi:hypothetical protein
MSVDSGIHIHITRIWYVREILVLPGCCGAISMAIQAMSKAIPKYYEHIRWMFLAVLTSHLVTSFARGLALLTSCRRRRHVPQHTPYMLAIKASYLDLYHALQND